MLITKEHQEAMVAAYQKSGKSTDEVLGYIDGINDVLKIVENQQPRSQPPVSDSALDQIRQAFADYRRAEGCSCCRDINAHNEAEKRLAELLIPLPYEDGSGWDWSKCRTAR